MLIICWAAKGGSGTTVVSCALALLAAQTQSTLLVDLAGDAPAALGITDPGGPGVHDWVLTSTAGSAAIEGLSLAVNDHLRVLPHGTERAPLDHPRWSVLAAALASAAHVTVVDAGTGCPPPTLFAQAEQRLLVTQPCYLALRRHASSNLTPTGVVLVQQAGRALTRQRRCSRRASTGARGTCHRAVHSRAVDAGLLASRLPRHLAAELRSIVVAAVAA